MLRTGFCACMVFYVIVYFHDKFYENDQAGEDQTLQAISNVLNQCQSYTTKDLNQAIKQFQPSLPGSLSRTTQFSSYFINVDGNSTNFNILLSEIHRIDHQFSIIGIAETNTDKPLQGLYQIPGYTGFYQNTLEGKGKGSGVALYVANNYNAEVMEHLGFCTPDIETIFVRISHSSNNTSLICGGGGGGQWRKMAKNGE